LDSIKRDKIVDISIIAGAIFLHFYVFPHHITTAEEYALASLSQDFFPKIIVWLIAGLATLHLALAIIKGRSPETEEDVEAWLSPKEEYNAYVSSLLIIAYLIIMKYVGFILSTIAVLAVLFVMQGVRGPIKVILTSFMVTIGVYLLFLYVLKVHFPMGLFFEWTSFK